MSRFDFLERILERNQGEWTKNVGKNFVKKKILIKFAPHKRERRLFICLVTRFNSSVG